MSAITWEQLTEAQRYALKEYGNGKGCYDFTSEAIGSLSYAGYFVLVQDDFADSPCYRITDAGRAVLAQQAENARLNAEVARLNNVIAQIINVMDNGPFNKRLQAIDAILALANSEPDHK